MSNYIKKSIRLLVAIVFIFSACIYQFNSFAAGTAKVLAVNEDIERISENEYLVPIYICENSGIMGFRIEFVYDKERITINSISKGSVTKVGSFDSVINSEGNWGRASVVWYNTEDVISDGTIAYIGVIVHDQTDSIIRVGYISEDTFNEKWEDVSLDCYNISFESQVEKMEDSIIDKKDDSVNIINGKTDEDPEKKNKSSIKELSPEDLKKKDYNNNESSMMVSISDGTLSLSDQEPSSSEIEKVKKMVNLEEESELKETAKKELQLQSIPTEFNQDSLKKSIVDELVNKGYKSIDEIPNEKKSDFWNQVKQRYIEDNDTNSSLDKINFDIFEEVVVISKEEIDQAYNEKNKLRYLNVVIIVIAVFTIIILVMKTYQNRKKQEMDKSTNVNADKKKEEVE